MSARVAITATFLSFYFSFLSFFLSWRFSLRTLSAKHNFDFQLFPLGYSAAIVSRIAADLPPCSCSFGILLGFLRHFLLCFPFLLFPAFLWAVLLVIHFDFCCCCCCCCCCCLIRVFCLAFPGARRDCLWEILREILSLLLLRGFPGDSSFFLLSLPVWAWTGGREGRREGAAEMLPVWVELRRDWDSLSITRAERECFSHPIHSRLNLSIKIKKKKKKIKILKDMIYIYLIFFLDENLWPRQMRNWKLFFLFLNFCPRSFWRSGCLTFNQADFMLGVWERLWLRCSEPSD